MLSGQKVGGGEMSPVYTEQTYHINTNMNPKVLKLQVIRNII